MHFVSVSQSFVTNNNPIGVCSGEFHFIAAYFEGVFWVTNDCGACSWSSEEDVLPESVNRRIVKFTGR
jgi:hypothetical protein